MLLHKKRFVFVKNCPFGQFFCCIFAVRCFEVIYSDAVFW